MSKITTFWGNLKSERKIENREKVENNENKTYRIHWHRIHPYFWDPGSNPFKDHSKAIQRI